jgi:hypothetical protein
MATYTHATVPPNGDQISAGDNDLSAPGDRRAPGAPELSTSAFGDQFIKGMTG